MKLIDILMVRVYITESSHLSKTISSYLKDEAKIRGFSVFRAISGFGTHGEHTAALIDFSLDLPLVIEFFDEKNKALAAIEHMSTVLKAEHISFWEAKAPS